MVDQISAGMADHGAAFSQKVKVGAWRRRVSTTTILVPLRPSSGFPVMALCQSEKQHVAQAATVERGQIFAVSGGARDLWTAEITAWRSAYYTTQ